VGIGVDFNTELVEALTKVRGANYFSVHSSEEFKRHLDEEFDFMVTPMVFDLDLKLDSDAYEIAAVYGSPDSDAASGRLMHVNTLFPSKSEGGETRGGVVLLKLRPTGRSGDLRLRASYVDREGRPGHSDAAVRFDASSREQYANTGIRKAVLLARYYDLMQGWMTSARGGSAASADLGGGIPVAPRPKTSGERGWEHTSDQLRVSAGWTEAFGQFAGYFEREMSAIGDSTLSQEVTTMRKLSRAESASRQ
jgi:Ca-activated chloride channel family protein